MIARVWRGATRAQDGEEYTEYLEATGLRAFRETPGNRGGLALRRREGDRAEFLLVSLWDSMDAVRNFAGAEPERAVFYAEDARFLVERWERVEHYEVVSRTAEGEA